MQIVQEVIGPYEVTLRVVLVSFLLLLTESNLGEQGIYFSSQLQVTMCHYTEVSVT